MAKSLMLMIRRLFWLLLAAALVIFSINNRSWLPLSFEPFGFSFELPVYGILFLGIFIGLLVAAGVTGWLRLKGLAARRQAERRAGYLEDQVSALSEDAHKAHADVAHASVRAATEALPNSTKEG